MTITGTEAYEAMRAHHRLLSDQLSTRAAAVSEAVAAARAHDPAVAAMIAYLAEEVLPHAVAEEETIYPAAAAQANLTGTVSEMSAEHSALLAAAGALAGLADGPAAAEQARHIAELFTAHAARENEALLPALLASSDVDLAALLAQMHRRAEEAVERDGMQAEKPAVPGGPASEPTRLPGGPASEPERDVRDMPPAQRRTAIFASYQDLPPGPGFVLVNDHDPLPLRYQFEAQYPGGFTWDYLETAPKTCRLRTGRPARD